MDKDTQKKLEERIREAEHKEIAMKARTIAHARGTVREDNYRDCGETHTAGFHYIFQTETLYIDRYEPNGWKGSYIGVVVKSAEQGRTYFSKGRMLGLGSQPEKITAYIPGVWEEELNKLYTAVCRQERETAHREKRKRAKENAAETDRLKENFGL